MPPLAAQNILWGVPFFFCASAQKKNGAPHKILSAAKPPFIHAKIVKEPEKSTIFTSLPSYVNSNENSPEAKGLGKK
jgi:hypothetical protein